MLTLNKDIIYKLLNQLGDRDLVSMFRSNGRIREIWNDQRFWLNRIVNMFPYVPIQLLKRYRKNRKWSEYYMSDLNELLGQNPDEFMEKGVKTGRLDIVMIAINKGSNIDIGSNWYIKEAVIRGYLDVTKYLFNNYLLPNRAEDYDLISDIFLHACRNEHLEIVKYLLDNVNIYNYIDALYETCKMGHLKVVQCLVQYLDERRGNINLDELFLDASSYGRLDVVIFLLEKGANVHTGDDLVLRICHYTVREYLTKNNLV